MINLHHLIPLLARTVSGDERDGGGIVLEHCNTSLESTTTSRELLPCARFHFLKALSRSLSLEPEFVALAQEQAGNSSPL